MKHFLTGVLALALTASGFQTADNCGEQLEKLKGALEKDRREWLQAYRDAKTDLEREKLGPTYPTKVYLPKFQELARQARGSTAAPLALEALFTVALHLDKDAMLAALREMVDAYVDSPLLEGMAAALFDAFYFGTTSENVPEGEQLLRRVAERSPLPAVRASARYSLVGLLMKQGDFTPARKAEAKSLLENLKKEYGDTSYGKRAEGLLFEVEHLQIGQEAPDFEAKDTDGKTFKLSDYRAKVVVVSFWGFW